MAKPQYPTEQGLWSRGKRPEPGYKGVSLGLPYEQAISNFRAAVHGRDDFDPAVLLVWGTMQATAVLNILKDAEKTFGEAGQKMVRMAIKRAGHEAMAGFIEASTFPENATESEKVSYLITGLNTVLYASLEKPQIISEDRSEFDILWCPHQDRYTAFDCRVQRYFVEGMFEAMEGRGFGGFTAWVEKLIPHGGDCCHFAVQRAEHAEGQNAWHSYSDKLQKRAFEKLAEKLTKEAE